MKAFTIQLLGHPGQRPSRPAELVDPVHEPPVVGHLAVPLHRWIRVGWVGARKLPTPGGHWVIWADADELDRMSRLRSCPRGWAYKNMLSKLTKPKARETD